MLDLSSINPTAGSGSGGEDKKRDELGQEDFLKLMTTQLNNQDPMKPMENGDFMAQIAQFTSASGIQDLQSSFKDFSESMQSNQSLQAAGLVGRQVLVESDRGYLPEGGELEGSVNLPSSVGNLSVSITDGSGQTVRELDLGSRPAGTATFQWDGRDDQGQPMPAGSYQIRASARSGGQEEDVSTQVAATVASVGLSRDGRAPQLELEGIGARSLSDVRQVK